MTVRGEITQSAQETDARSLEDSTAGRPLLLPTSQNDPYGLGRVKAFWNSFSCDYSIAELQSVQLSFFARIIHGGFYCNCGHAATTSQYAHNLHTGGRARPSRPRRTASSTPQPLGAPRALLAWRLHSFVTSPHESCAPAAPRWVPVLPVRSRGSMPALGAINGS